MLPFIRINSIEQRNNNYILLKEYFYNKSENNNNTTTWKFHNIPLEKEVAASLNIEIVFDAILNLGETLYNFLKEHYKPYDKTHDYSFDYFLYNIDENDKNLISILNEWIIKNGLPYSVNSENIKINKKRFIKDSVNLYVIFRTHKNLFHLNNLEKKIDRLKLNEVIDNKTKFIIEKNKIIKEINEFRIWYNKFVCSVLGQIELRGPIKPNNNEAIKGYIKKLSGNDFLLSDTILTVTSINDKEFEEEEFNIDSNIFSNQITDKSIEEFRIAFRGINVCRVYNMTHKIFQTYTDFSNKEFDAEVNKEFEDFKIDFQHILYNYDEDTYISNVSCLSLMGLAYFYLSVCLTHNNLGSLCSNPKCNNRFEKKSQQLYCNSNDCKKYRNNLKSSNNYHKKKVEKENIQ